MRLSTFALLLECPDYCSSFNIFHFFLFFNIPIIYPSRTTIHSPDSYQLTYLVSIVPSDAPKLLYVSTLVVNVAHIAVASIVVVQSQLSEKKSWHSTAAPDTHDPVMLVCRP